MINKVTLSGRKTAKQLFEEVGNNAGAKADPTGSKHQELELLKQNQHEHYQTKSGPAASKFMREPNAKVAVTALVKSYKRNASAGSESILKYTRAEQKQMLLQDIKDLMDKYSQSIERTGAPKKTNLAKCQEYVDLLYKGLVEAQVPIHALIVHE